MTHSPDLSRRELLKFAGAAALALPTLSGVALRGADAKSAPKKANADAKLHVGVAGFSLRELNIEACIAVLKQLKVDSFGLFRAHVRIEEGTVEECREGAKKFRDAGIIPVTTGVVNFTNDEAKARRAFENAKAAGLTMMTCKPAKDCFPLLDRLVKEYDFTLAIHNHGPEDNVYPSPNDAWQAVQPYDRRIGLCIDVGHAMRAGTDPVAAIRKYRERIYDLHLKDSLAVSGAVKDIPIEAGHGNIDLRSVCAALNEINYKGVIGYEYEVVATNPVIGLAESLGYLRGLMAGMA